MKNNLLFYGMTALIFTGYLAVAVTDTVAGERLRCDVRYEDGYFNYYDGTNTKLPHSGSQVDSSTTTFTDNVLKNLKKDMDAMVSEQKCSSFSKAEIRVVVLDGDGGRTIKFNGHIVYRNHNDAGQVYRGFIDLGLADTASIAPPCISKLEGEFFNYYARGDKVMYDIPRKHDLTDGHWPVDHGLQRNKICGTIRVANTDENPREASKIEASRTSGDLPALSAGIAF